MLPPSPPLKPVEWMGSALDDLRECPEAVQDEVGYAIHLVQLGEHPPGAKRLRGELAGMIELVVDHDSDTYRAVYAVKLQGVVYVLHVFQKKSRRGIATPRHDIALIRSRYRWAKAHYAEHYAGEQEER
jgi:phage-related protein